LTHKALFKQLTASLR